MTRSREGDGEFVYAVRSTGVVCRPSCASRRPRREHVTFFDSLADALGVGYRPCRRCHPERPIASDAWVERVGRACRYLANADGHVSLARLARLVGGSPFHLQRRFKQLVGLTPREYADACRMKRVKRQLRTSPDVTGAIVDAGYGSNARFYERAASKLGMRPTTYQRGASGLRVGYSIVDSPLGRLLVAATDRGVCSVCLGATDAELVRALAREYPHAIRDLDRAGLAGWTTAVLAHLEGKRPRLELPLDIQATAFQWQVWSALAAIPYGETRSYGQIAHAIGRPTASRAVARACASNPVALAIPCHRVVPSSGGVGGYRWGVGRKKALLTAEHTMKA